MLIAYSAKLDSAFHSGCRAFLCPTKQSIGSKERGGVKTSLMPGHQQTLHYMTPV